MEFELPFPRNGLSDDKAKGKQEPGTTGDALNVRLIDPETGRSRGAQRAGLSKYLADPLSAVDTAVQDLAQTMRPVDHIKFETLAETTPGSAQVSATGSITVLDATTVQENDTTSPGDIVTLSDGRTSETFQFTGLFTGSSVSNPDYLPVPVVAPGYDDALLLETLGDAITASNLEIGWTVDITVTPPVLNLVNARAGIGVLGNTTITIVQATGGTFSSESFTGGADAGANTLQIEWEKQPPGASETAAGFRDLDNNLWTLSSNGVAVRYNPDGVVLATINVPVPGGSLLVKVLTEDASGNIYFASTQSADGNGDDLDSEIYRFKSIPADEQDELPTYELDWTWATDKGSIYDMAERSGVLYVLFRRKAVASTGAPYSESPAEIAGYSPLSSATPIVAFSHLLETPPHSMAVLQDGSIAIAGKQEKFATHISGQSVAREVETPDLWTPWDLPNYRERLHFWVRAEDGQATGPVQATDGDEVVLVPDHRASPPTGKSAPHDTTTRTLVKNERDGPIFDDNGMGRSPGLRFDAAYTDGSGSPIAGECLITAASTGATAKTLVTDSLATQLSPFPSWPSSRYAVCFIVRLDAADVTTSVQNRVLFSQNSTTSLIASPLSTSHAFTTGTRGGDYTAGGFDPATGGEVQYHPGPFYALAGTHLEGSVTLGDAASSVSGFIPNWNTNPIDRRIAIVSIVKNSAAGSGLDVVRVNGRQVDVFTHKQDTSNSSPFVLGCRRQDDAENATHDLFTAAKSAFAALPSFKGSVGEIITVLSDSSADNSPHDLQFDAPYAGTGGLVGGDEAGGYEPSGSGPSAVAHTDAVLASEIERIEGYLAHKYGFADALPYLLSASTDARSATHYYVGHPFGGNGFYPQGPDKENDDTFHLRSWPAKTLLFTPGLKLIDSAWGSGFAHVGADDEDHIVAAGRSQMNGLDYRWDDGSRANTRRLTATAGGFRNWKHATGRINLTGVPADGITVTVTDGTTSTTFEFNTGAATVPNTLIDTSSLAGTQVLPDERELAQLLAAAIEAAYPTTMRVYLAGGTSTAHTVFLVNAVAAFAANTTISTTSTSSTLTVSGFAGGSDQGDDWVQYTGDASDTLRILRVPINFDTDGNFYYPNRSEAGSSDAYGRLAADGALFMVHAFDDDEEPREVIPLLNPPDFDEDAIVGVESLYVLTKRPATASDSTVYRLRAATVTEELGADFAMRQSVYLGVSGGSIVKFARDGAPTVATGGASVLTAGSPYIQSTTLFGDVFFTDGVSSYVYKVDDDEVVKFESSSAGAAPRRFRLVAGWRQRLVVARVPGDDFNWYMSKQGDPYNWNTNPVVINAGQAVVGSGRTEQLAGPGDNPDVINSLIPWSDDLLIFGGDRSIQRLTGDPMAGGQIDLITESTGIAFGTPWTRSPSGILYFFGSRGGVWAMSPQGQVQRLTTWSIERRMRDLQLGQFKLRLVWNYEDEGLHVIPIAYDLDSRVVVKSWFLDVKHGGWWEDEWASSSVMPTATMLYDGDAPDDRKMILGCRDGRVRFWDETAITDDGARIQSHVRLGPLAPEVGAQFRFSKLTAVLASTQGGVEFDAFTGEDPETLELAANGKLRSGRNAPRSERWNGPSSWVTLRSGGPQGWALESLSVTANRTGRKRVT